MERLLNLSQDRYNGKDIKHILKLSYRVKGGKKTLLGSSYKRYPVINAEPTFQHSFFFDKDVVITTTEYTLREWAMLIMIMDEHKILDKMVLFKDGDTIVDASKEPKIPFSVIKSGEGYYVIEYNGAQPIIKGVPEPLDLDAYMAKFGVKKTQTKIPFCRYS